MAPIRPKLMILLALTALSACHRPHPRGASAAASEPTSPEAKDLGASVLAGVLNARAAIAQHDRLDAANDVGHALTLADKLIGQTSVLFPDPPAPVRGARSSPRPGAALAASRPARLSRFGVQVKLVSADAALQTGDLAAADADLASIQNSVPSSRDPPDLPLLRADESLDLAVGGSGGEQSTSVAAQLANAEAQLRDYRGASHARDARALAADIGSALDKPGAPGDISDDRVELWSDRVGGWV